MRKIALEIYDDVLEWLELMKTSKNVAVQEAPLVKWQEGMNVNQKR